MISGSGGLNKTGAGVMVLASTASYQGPTNISGGTVQIGNIVAPGTGYGVFNRITEAQGYQLIYQLNIPTFANYSNTNPVYAVDNSASIATGSFNRIGYYMELQTASSPLYYMYVSFDAAPFATQANKLGVPTVNSGEFYHYGMTGSGQVQDMDIVTNAPGISGLTYNASGIGTAMNLSSGLAQFWPGNYGNGNGYGVPGATGGQWGTADDGAGTGTGYGSMKLGSDGVGGGPNSMLLSFNNWGNGTPGVGIGNGSNVNSWFPGVANQNNDYTFSNNAGSYTVEDLEVVVGNGLGGAYGQLSAVSPVSVTNGSMLDLNNTSQTVASLSGDAASVVALGGGTLTFGGIGSATFAGTIGDTGGTSSNTGGSLVMSGSGVQTLTGLNTYTGPTTVTAGTLAFTSIANADGVTPSSLGMPSAANGTITLGNGANLTKGYLQFIGSEAARATARS